MDQREMHLELLRKARGILIAIEKDSREIDNLSRQINKINQNRMSVNYLHEKESNKSDLEQQYSQQYEQTNKKKASRICTVVLLVNLLIFVGSIFFLNYHPVAVWCRESETKTGFWIAHVIVGLALVLLGFALHPSDKTNEGD